MESVLWWKNAHVIDKEAQNEVQYSAYTVRERTLGAQAEWAQAEYRPVLYQYLFAVQPCGH